MAIILANMKKAVFDREFSIRIGGGVFNYREISDFLDHIDGIKALLKQAKESLTHPDVAAITSKFAMPSKVLVENLEKASAYLDA